MMLTCIDEVLSLARTPDNPRSFSSFGIEICLQIPDGRFMFRLLFCTVLNVHKVHYVNSFCLA